MNEKLNEGLVDLALNIHHFNQDVMELNIKYSKEIERLNNIIKESIEYLQTVYAYLLVDKNFIDDDLQQKQKEIKDLMKILKSGDE